MELIAKRPAYGDYGHVERGQVIKVENEKRAKELLKGKNFAVYDRKAAEKAAADKAAAEKEQADAAHVAELEAANTARAAEIELSDLRIAVVDLNTTIAEQAEKLAGIPALEKLLAEKDEALSSASAKIAELTSQIAELKAAAEKPAAKKAAEEKGAGSKEEK